MYTFTPEWGGGGSVMLQHGSELISYYFSSKELYNPGDLPIFLTCQLFPVHTQACKTWQQPYTVYTSVKEVVGM